MVSTSQFITGALWRVLLVQFGRDPGVKQNVLVLLFERTGGIYSLSAIRIQAGYKSVQHVRQGQWYSRGKMFVTLNYNAINH